VNWEDVPMSSQGGQKPKLWPCIIFTFFASTVLVAGILLFPTVWNPGMPLLLAGVFATLLGVARIVGGLGKYYRMECDVATLLLIWMATCSIFSLDLHASQRSVASFTGGVAFLLFCQAVIQTRKQWRGVAYTLIWICFFASILAWVIGLAQAAKTGILPPLQGTFANQDTFAVLPLLAICLVLGLIERSGPKLTWMNMFMAAFFMLTLYSTGCRAALVGFIAAALCFSLPLQFLRKEKSEKTRLFVGFPLALGLLFSPFLGYQYAAAVKWNRVVEGTTMEYQSLRVEVLQNGWRAIMHNPLFGAGPGAFGQAYQTVRPEEHEDIFVNIAHNDFLEFAVECGLPGLFLWCALTWLAIKLCWVQLRHGRRPTEAASVLSAVVALAVFSVFNFIVVQRPVLWAQLWLFGLAFSFPSNRERWQEAPVVRYGAGLILVGFGLWTSSWGYRSLQVETLYTLGERAETKLELEEASNLYNAAAELGIPRYDRILQRLALMEKLRLFSGEDNLNQQLSLLQDARKANPKRIPLLLKLAEAQERSGQIEEARATLDAAWAAAPNNRYVFTSRLTFLISQSELETAAEALSQVTYQQWKDNESRFAGVLYVLFQNDPPVGEKVLAKWLKEHPDERGYALADSLTATAKRKSNPSVELAVLEVWKAAQPKNTCLEERYAKALGEANGPDEEFSYLSQVLLRDIDNSDTCYSNLLKRWAKLGVENSKGPAVETRVADYLETYPTRHWARVFLADRKTERGEYTAAVSLMREGLDKRPNDPELLIGLGGVFERQGSLELAVNYYREAARRYPENQEAALRLKETLKKL